MGLIVYPDGRLVLDVVPLTLVAQKRPKSAFPLPTRKLKYLLLSTLSREVPIFRGTYLSGTYFFCCKGKLHRMRTQVRECRYPGDPSDIPVAGRPRPLSSYKLSSTAG